MPNPFLLKISSTIIQHVSHYTSEIPIIVNIVLLKTKSCG